MTLLFLAEAEIHGSVPRQGLGRLSVGPQSFCVVPHNHAPLLASGTEQDSRRSRTESAYVTGAFNANQGKRPDLDDLPIASKRIGPPGRARPSDIPFRPELGESTVSPVNRTTSRRPAGHCVHHESDAPFWRTRAFLLER
jgi:hypothetical protein